MPAVTILSSNLPVAILDSFISMDWTRPYYTAGKFTLTVDPSNPAAVELVKGRIILPPDSNICYIIEQVLREDDGSKSQQLLTASGRDLGGFFEERLALPTTGLDYDAQLAVHAETAMKHYVNLNAGPGAVSQRQIPGLTIAADAARGATVNVQARYQLLSDILFQIGQTAGMGWQVLYNGGTFLFDVIPGVDRHASVFFDAAFDTTDTQSWLTSDVGTKSFDYVAGQGVGAARTIVTRFTGGAEPTGFARRELFTDARDLSDTTAMQTRGDANLAALAVADRFEATIPTGSSFKYRVDWDLGDLVTIRNKWWNLQQTVRIVGVELKLEAGGTSPIATITLGRPFPTLTDAVSGSSGDSGVSVTADSGAGGSGASLSSTTPAALTVGDAGAVGTGTTAARSDHVHAMPSASDILTANGAILPSFHAHKSAAQTTTAGAFTQVLFDVEDSDALGNFASSAFTAPTAGWYMLYCAVTLTASGTDSRSVLSVLRNGVEEGTRLADRKLPGTDISSLSGSVLLNLAQGDVITIGLDSLSVAQTFQITAVPNLNAWAMRKMV